MIQRNQKIQQFYIIKKISLILIFNLFLCKNVVAQNEYCPKAIKIQSFDTMLLKNYYYIIATDIVTSDTVKILSQKKRGKILLIDFNNLLDFKLYCTLTNVSKIKLNESEFYLPIFGKEFSIDIKNKNIIIKKSNELLFFSKELDSIL